MVLGLMPGLLSSLGPPLAKSSMLVLERPLLSLLGVQLSILSSHLIIKIHLRS